jgi:hypothetical protein
MQVRLRLTELCLDIETGYQISRRRFAEALFTYIIARLDPRRGKSYSGLEKANRRMNFSAMEIYGLIHVLKQQPWQIRRVDRPEKRTIDGSMTTPCIRTSELLQNKEKRNRLFIFPENLL